jgi:hypothetical protein
LNAGASPLSWASDLVIRVDGLDVQGKGAGSWRVALNEVPFKVVYCFVGPRVADPAPHTEVRLVLDGLNSATLENPQDAATMTAAAIRRLAPHRWSTNRVALEVSCDGVALSQASPPGESPGVPGATFELITLPRRLVCIGALAAIAGLFYWAGARTGALRDNDPLNPDFRQRTYSLARCQLAFWTVLVVGSFLYIYLVTGFFNGVLTDTALWLLGISAGTSALAQAAGTSHAGAGQPVAPPIPQRSAGFLLDILSDAQGVNVHRLQMLIWTAVFGGILTTRVVTSLAFPEYDTTTYALMGISSGTYVWFKRTEA